MRRTTILLCSALLMGFAPSTSAGDAPRTYNVDYISSDWVHRDAQGQLRWYVVQAEIATDPDTGRIIASKARGGIGHCSNGGRLCGLDPIRDFEVTGYETDALMQTTTLDVRWGRRTAALSFTGGSFGSAAALPQTIHPCDGEATLVTDASRTVDGTGVVFGRRVSTRHDWDREGETIQRTMVVC